MITLELLTLQRLESHAEGVTQYGIEWKDDQYEHLAGDVQEELDAFVADLEQTYGAENICADGAKAVTIRGHMVSKVRAFHNVGVEAEGERVKFYIAERKGFGELELSVHLTFQRKEDAALFELHYSHQITVKV